MLTLLQILDNVIFLSFLGLAFFFVERSRKSLGDIAANLLIGLSFGLIAFLVTAAPVQLADGATVDARAGPVILASVLGGPIAGLIAAVFGGLARGVVGGSFAFSGMIVYLVYAAIGMAIRHFRLIGPATISTPRSILLLAVTSMCGASAMFFLIRPTERAVQWLQDDLPFILVANTLSVAIGAIVIGIALQLFANAREVEQLNETLSLAKSAGKFGIWDFDMRSGTVEWDDRSLELHEMDLSNPTGTFEDWEQTVHPDDVEMARSTLAQALETNEPFHLEYRVPISDSQSRIIKGSAVVLRDEKEAPVRVVGTNLDITELRTAEAKLIEATSAVVQAQKFDTIGQLTGGVAHDFNNLLAVIMGNQELLQDELRKTSLDFYEMHSLVDASIQATQRGAELTQNMLAYARKAQLVPVVTDLNQVVRETQNWLRRTIESRIEIETALQADLWPVLVDRVSVQSALVNLLVNARDAFESSGRVTVETSNIRIDPDDVQEPGEDIRPGRYVRLAVTDNGSGIAPDLIDYIFDPFYTTKPIGKGSGLGLSMVQGFVKQSGGAIRVNSELGVGTSFKLFFPAHIQDTDAPETLVANSTSTAPQERTNARILLVEDQEEVLQVLEKTLLSAGFDVVTAESGDAAYAIFSADDNFDLVATDIVMPGSRQGPRLARDIRALNPTIPFIFLSGYASEATVFGNGLRPEDIRLMKPVSSKILLEAVHTAISENTRSQNGS